jgi:NAD+ diphosphatase
MTLAYVSSPLDRDHLRRMAPDGLQGLRGRADCKVVRVRGDQVETRDGLPVHAAGPATADEIYLGVAPDGVAWFAAPAAETAELSPLRGLMLSGAVDAAELSILAQARSLMHWHERHGFCANCGAKTAMADGGYRRTCAACGAEHFPRTDPVVIMVVRDGERILLGRQAAWAEGMYSALAGFMEPGETIEQAARREVFEEAGIRVGEISYVASQPWPFPSSLMIGLVGEALSSAITIDRTEIEDVRWFSRDDIAAMLTRTHPAGLHASHPYAIAHHLLKVASGA